MAEDSRATSETASRSAGAATQEARPGQAENEVGGGFRKIRLWLAKTRAALNMSLSRFQTIVGLTAGLLSISGALFSATQFFRPGPGRGEVVAVVQEATSERGVPDATIEILTPQNALVATLTPNFLGRAHQKLKEGAYRVRVSHPRFAVEVRQIQVFSGQTVEVRVRLRAGASSPLAHAGRTVSTGVRAIKRALGL